MCLALSVFSVLVYSLRYPFALLANSVLLAFCVDYTAKNTDGFTEPNQEAI